MLPDIYLVWIINGIRIVPAMADVHDKETRSYNMSRIGNKNTKPEMIVRKFLFSKGLRFRLHDKKLPGNPDIILPRYRTLIFVNGCFWHAHKGCKYFVIPRTRTQWWTEKIMTNIERDRLNHRELRDSGWRVIVIWECELKKDKVEHTLSKLLEDITNPEEDLF